MNITSLDQLQAIKQTEVIELPAFEDGTPLNVEVKKPNMMQLISSGKIPNTLLSSAMDMFNGKTGEKMQKASEELRFEEAISILARSTMVPSSNSPSVIRRKSSRVSSTGRLR